MTMIGRAGLVGDYVIQDLSMDDQGTNPPVSGNEHLASTPIDTARYQSALFYLDIGSAAPMGGIRIYVEYSQDQLIWYRAQPGTADDTQGNHNGIGGPLSAAGTARLMWVAWPLGRWTRLVVSPFTEAELIVISARCELKT